MYNLFDYINFRCDLSFEEKELNILDLAIFSQFLILDFSFLKDKRITLKECLELYKQNDDKKLGLLIPNELNDLFIVAANTNRYKDLMIGDYVDIIDEDTIMQFKAVTIKINKDLNVIVFNPTDDTIISFKEDFNMMISDIIPSQEKALEYCFNVLEKKNGYFYIVGHSKGGNLATYGGLNVKEHLKSKILKIYNFDGPGFEFMDITNIPKNDLDKIITLNPTQSIIGRLLNQFANIKVVNSSAFSLQQHNILTWEVEKDDFVYGSKLSLISQKIEEELKSIISSMDLQYRIKFIDILFGLLDIGNTKRLIELNGRFKEVFKNYTRLNKENKNIIRNPIRQLLKNKDIRKFLFKSFRSIKKINKETQ